MPHPVPDGRHTPPVSWCCAGENPLERRSPPACTSPRTSAAASACNWKASTTWPEPSSTSWGANGWSFDTRKGWKPSLPFSSNKPRQGTWRRSVDFDRPAGQGQGRARGPPRAVEGAICGTIRRPDRLPSTASPFRGGAKETAQLGTVEGNIDKILACRFKRRGMNWSQDGAHLLAKIMALRCNGELADWMR